MPRSRGGKNWRVGQFTSDDVDRVSEGELIRVERIVLRGLEHQGADGVMGEHETEKLLADQFGGLASQHDLCAAAQMSFQFVVDALVFPPLGIERRQLRRRSEVRVQERCQEPERLTWRLYPILDDPHG